MSAIEWSLRRGIVGIVVVAACSGRPARHEPPREPIPSSPDAAVTAGPTAAECARLGDHAVAIGAADRAAAPAAQRPTDAELVTIRAELAPLIDECRALTPAQLRCGLAAATLAELTACQDRPSSSTSNSSVAPPGIAPGAPRSP